ncbi:hypothetical protein CG51_17395 [Haematobacter missouriensis]|uniref:DUF2076 domain-containing protein n=1 Tax=Haematobacter missouriensis TaxID=366616 RepID=A0A212AMV5_9RHOB|nr:DUF2076 domain-containing protein [Haematobacter missouriensis]KFI24735.1 hypothetical protein CG51_17395 [Haematobacter missouriensis]OWJ75058.1 hypothetical protein CDV53_11705 [Haematobacter missouriensis]OWJ82763.1 hypothetical protein CDV52_12160 [Haematobacter missouriensis]
MDHNDKQAITGLFGKLADVERQSPQRDREAEAFIAQQVARQPGAPYYLAQTVVVQEQALNAAEARIADLEAQVHAARQGQGGFLSRLLGGPGAQPRPRQPAGQSLGQPAPGMAQPGRSGGFLGGAAQTAMGVAGGMMLANAIGGMFAGSAEAGESPDEPADMGFDDGGDWEEF